MNTLREESWLWLCSIPGLNWQQKTALLKYFGSPQEILAAPEKEFLPWERIGIRWVRKAVRAQKSISVGETLEQLRRNHISFLSREHPDFPGRLLVTADCPYGLFVKGSLPDPDVMHAAIVGARSCSNYGKVIACDLAGRLAAEQIPVISGMAHGIDSIAQRAALENGGKTYAVLGSGADICYPKENFSLYMDLAGGAHGGIISEYPCGTKPLPPNFPQRNRIISALSDVVVVIEAREKSGSLITAEFALEQGKEIYAVPGRCCDERSGGCNRLIRDGAAVYISADIFIEEMRSLFEQTYPGGGCGTGKLCPGKVPEDGISKEKAPDVCGPDGPGKTDGRGNLSEQEDGVKGRVLEVLDLEPTDAGTICVRCGLGMHQVLSALVELQLDGKAAEVTRNCYARSSL